MMTTELVEEVRAWAHRHPDAVAVRHGTQEVTYAQLWRAGQDWAATLQALPRATAGRTPGGIAGSTVAVLGQRDAMLPAIQLGTWLAGTAYLPLDPGLPDSRIGDIIRGAGCAAAVTAPDWRARIRACPVVTHAAPSPQQPGSVTREPDPLAYVISTSGSTGVPKAVEIAHAGLAARLRWYRRRFRLAPGDRVAMFAGLGFDQSVLDIWGTLSAGATLVVPDDRHLGDPQALVAFLDTERVDHTYLPAVVAEQIFTAQPWPRTLRSLDVGGEQLRRWPPKEFPCAVHNGYGPTETTIVATLSGDLRHYPQQGPAPIGTAAEGLTLRLVDDSAGEVTVPGLPGELLIAGTGLARGYRNDPAATAAAFVRQGGRRWYRTGDICQWTPGGELVFVGRRDGQVKIRGHRIELGEIEHGLLGCGGVHQAAAAVVGDGSRRMVHAWIVGEAQPSGIRAELAARLPAVMVPAVISRVARLPMTVNGKVDRSALVASVPSAGLGPEQEYASTLEEIIAGVWAEVLGNWPTREGNFLQLGGSSLAAAQVTGQLRRLFGVSLAPTVLLSWPVLREYSARVSGIVRANESPAVARLAPGAREQQAPLSYLQEHRLAKELRAAREGVARPLAFVQLAIEVSGKLSDERIHAALSRVVNRHETLRTGFHLGLPAGAPRAVIGQQLAVRLEISHHPDLDAPARTATVRAAQQRLTSEPLDLAAAPLWRVRLCRFAEDHAVLVLVVDHLIADGWSTEVLFDDVCAALDEAGWSADGTELQYRDWVAWQRDRLDGAGRSALVDFWRSALAGTSPFPALPIPPVDLPRPHGRTVVTARAGREVSSRLFAQARRAGATPLMVALHAASAGWAVVTGEQDVVIHTPTTNRTVVGVDRILGWLAHSVLIRLRACPDEEMGTLLEQARTVALEALRHEDIPLPLLLRDLQPDAHGRPRRPDRLFLSFEPAPGRSHEVSGASLRLLAIPDQEAVAEPGLSFYASVTGEGLVIEVVADPATVPDRFTRAVAEAIEAVLRCTAQTPTHTIAAVRAELRGRAAP